MTTDLRSAWRSLRRAPGFAIFTIAILSTTIATTTALFSVVDHVILRPFPFPEPERLVAVHEVLPKSATPLSPVNAAHFEEWRDATHSFEQMALLFPVTLTMTGGSEPEQIGGARVSAALFRILGTSALHGRTFSDDEDILGRDRVVVLGYDLWTRRFGGNPAVVGHQINLDSESYTVVGVLAPHFGLSALSRLYPMAVTADRPQIWMPIGLRPFERAPGQAFNFAAIARLKPQVSAARALAELNAVQHEIGRRLAGNDDLRASVTPLQEQLTGTSRRDLELLLATAAVVLLVACVNIANLFLTRGMSRQHELAMRRAIGASRSRLFRQLFVESLMIAAASGFLGIVMTPVLTRAIVLSAPANLPRVEEISVDGRVLMFTAVISLAGAVVVGVLPAWRSSAVPMSALQSGSKGASAGGDGRLRSLFVALETAASSTAVIIAILLAVSLANVLSVDAGFDRIRTIAGELRLPATRYNVERATIFLRALKEATQSIPGVVSVGISDRVPFKGEGGNSPIALEGTVLPRLLRPIASLQLADGAYFRTLGIPLVGGRVFDEKDRQRSPVAVVAASAAARIWAGQNPIGKRFRIGADSSPLIEIVGVVGDVRGVSLENGPRPTVYLPYWHVFVGQASIVVRTAAEPNAIVQPLHAAIRQLDVDMAPPAFETIEQIVARSVGPRRFQVNLALLLAMTALVLTSLGLYSVLTITASSRRHEMAIRVALGAKPEEIRRLVLGRAVGPVGIGIGAGFVSVLAVSPFLRGLLFGISPTDPGVFTVTAIVLGTVAALAGFLPAYRASQVNPAGLLR